MEKKILRVQQESETGMNVGFINLETNRRISKEQVIDQIEKGNNTYDNYHIVEMANGNKYIRSNPDKNGKNNLG